MKSEDVLALCNHPRAEHGRAFERRSGLIGAIIAALLIGTALVKAYVPTAHASPPYTYASEEEHLWAKTVERSGALYSLPILF